MKYQFVIAILFFSFPLFSQEKGVAPINNHPETSSGQAYAVVVGISDYQDESIPDLRFADKDAEAFAEFLRSPAGGSLDNDHLKVLINENATSGQIMIDALYWLLDECQEGDQAIIYFSGHGDVERKISRQPGHLLCYDAPPSAYMAGGTLRLGDLQDIIFTLSSDMNVRVTIITDACRSGKLAGNEIGGSQLTNSNLAQQFANEIKILSCQPDEFSIEGEQWGGGRGAFSYHLIDGLYGMADRNNDLSVNLMEVRSYLEDKVSTEVAPHNQLPMTVGNGREELVEVYPELLEKIKQQKSGQTPVFSGTDSRGMEEEILATLDSTTHSIYRQFKKAVTEKRFLFPEENCADHYYNQLIADDRLGRLHNSMRRNYAAALQDDAQQVVNAFLKTIDSVCVIDFQEKYLTYKDYPAYLQRAIELLGDQHYMYPVLQARRLYFQGFVYQMKYKPDRTGYDPNAEYQLYQKALEYEPDMPLGLLEMAFLQYAEFNQLDSAAYYFDKIMRQNPNWIMAYNERIKMLYHLQSDPDTIKYWIDKGLEVDPSSLILNVELGNWYMRRRQDKKAASTYTKVIDLVSTGHCFYGSFVFTYMNEYDYRTAERLIKKGLTDQPENALYNYVAGYIYMNMGKDEAAEEAFKKSISLDKWNFTYPHGLGLLYLTQGRFEEAATYFNQSIQRGGETNGYYGYEGLYLLHMIKGEEKEALRYMDQAITINAAEAISMVRAHSLATHWGDTTSNIYANVDLLFETLQKAYPDHTSVDFHYSIIQSKKGDIDMAFENLATALAGGTADQYKYLQLRDDLAPLRERETQWEVLMREYFPEEF